MWWSWVRVVGEIKCYNFFALVTENDEQSVLPNSAKKFSDTIHGEQNVCLWCFKLKEVSKIVFHFNFIENIIKFYLKLITRRPDCIYVYDIQLYIFIPKLVCNWVTDTLRKGETSGVSKLEFGMHVGWRSTKREFLEIPTRTRTNLIFYLWS